MMRWLRRLFLLGLLTGAGVGAYRVWLQRQSSATTSPEWPSLATGPTAKPDPITMVAASPAMAASPATRWVTAVNGDCPDGYPVKANDNSRIFHVPGGRFYARTVAERCYANTDDAVADGYRPAKA